MFRLISTVLFLSAVFSFNVNELKKYLARELLKDEFEKLFDNEREIISDCIGKEDGNYGDSNRCDGFIQCVGGQTFKQTCPGGLAYSPMKDQCNGPVCNTGSSNPTYCGSLSDGDYKYPSDCRSYVTCTNGLAYLRNCNKDNVGLLEWNENEKRCDYPESAKCTSAGSSPSHCTMMSRLYAVGEEWQVECYLSCSCKSGGTLDCRQICPENKDPCGSLGVKSYKKVPSDIVDSCMCKIVDECNM